MKLVRELYDNALTGWKDNYDLATDDFKFLNGEQWKNKDVVARGDRPMVTINRLPSILDLVVGMIKQAKMSIKVRPIDSQGDPVTAKIFEGLIRNIETISSADTAYETAISQVLAGGFGFFRVITEYADDDTFNQDIKIKRIINPFTVLFDPSVQEIDFSDAQYCFVTELMKNEEFKSKYPKARLESFGTSPQNKQWIYEDEVRVADYYYFKDGKKDELLELELPDSSVHTIKRSNMDDQLKGLLESGEIKVKRSRKVVEKKVVQQKINGIEVLEETDWAGSFIPVIPVIGKELNIDGKQVYRGITRFSKDPQRVYNYMKSTIAEMLGLQPKVPFVAEINMIKDYMEYWKNANNVNYSVLPYTSKDSNGQVITATPPSRPDVNQPSAALFQQERAAIDDLKGTTGIFDASRGAQSNETSGKAIEARQSQGDSVNFEYRDNLRRALTHLGRVLVDLIPHIYDAERTIRILGEDDRPAVVQLFKQNILKGMGQEGDDVVGEVDLQVGKYDVTVSIGPQIGTERQEMANNMLKMVEIYPPYAPIIMPEIIKVSDWPGAQKIIKSLEQVQQQQQQAQQEAQQQQGQQNDLNQLEQLKKIQGDNNGRS